MKTLYNEGRVVGYSAYEVYVRHLLSEYPDETPIEEKEWLSATIGKGSSMILRIPAGTTAGYHDYVLPSASSLCSGTILTASVFNGEVEYDSTGWATTVTDYGPCVSNTSSLHPNESGSNIPSKLADNREWLPEDTLKCTEYMKVIDGVGLQPGTWSKTTSGNPYMDFTPNLGKCGSVRLRFAEPIEHEFCILFTGFVNRGVIKGTSLLDTMAVDTPNPENGDFLGTESYPWSAKIVFTISNELMYILNNKSYERKLPKSGQSIEVKDKSVIDFESTDIGNYYTTLNKSSVLPMDVTTFNSLGDGASVLAGYQLNKDYPSILYGAKVEEVGQQNMYPIDIAAPNTVKVFESKELALNYPKVIPNVYSLYHDTEAEQIYLLDKDSTEEDMHPIVLIKTENIGTEDHPIIQSVTETPKDTIKTLSLIDTEGNQLGLDGADGSIDLSTIDGENESDITWDDIIQALDTNKKLNVLGDRLRDLRRSLPDIKSTGILELTGEGDSSVGGTLSAAKEISTGAGYVTFKSLDGLRLYISNTMPSAEGVPEGSIGIGW